MTWPIHELPRGRIHVTRAENVYPTMEDGSVTLIISDGPYRLKPKLAWDRFRSWDHFRDWYRPHVEAWGRVCAPAASVYVWGTDDSASELRPLMREHGWTKRVRVTWDKVATPAGIGWKGCRTWLDSTEVCDVWTRGDAAFTPDGPPGFNVWRFDLQNDIRPERLYLPGSKPDPRSNRGWVTRESLHPCQKPLAFYDRIIRASSRPGDRILEPFGGTCRAAVTCERLPATDARRYVCVEPDEDGRGYVPAVLASLGQGGSLPDEQGAQPSLWGAA